MRRLLALVSLIIFVDAMLFGALTPLVPGYADAFGLSKLDAGLLVGAFGGGALLGGLPGGVLAGRRGPRSAVVFGLVLLAASSFAFAFADSPAALGLSRFAQGLSSTTTWAGALSWLTVSAPRERRGVYLGSAFGLAVLGAILGPMFGAIAKAVGIRATFTAVGVLALLLVVIAWAHPRAAREVTAPGALARALADPAFVVGLWLNTLPAFFFGTLYLLVPLALADAGRGTFAIAGVFLAAGVVETGANPLLGRLSDRRGRLLPIRLALAGAVVVGAALATTERPAALLVLVIAAAVSFGGFYTPGMALVSDRAERSGLAQGMAFGVMNSAWALGQVSGPALGGALADATSDAGPYLLCAGLCGLTLLAVTFRRAAPRPA